MTDRVRPFRFSVGLGANVSDPKAIRDFARQAEGLGYSVVTIADHFSEASAPFPALLIAAEATTTLRVGTLVLDNDFRHPAMLAKEAASVDVMTGGRLELGIGAGWFKDEYKQSGIPYDRPGVRIERLGESIEILTGLFGDAPFSYSGKHYTITDLPGTPKPIQRPRPTIQVGGGSPVILRMAGRLVDSVSVAPRTGATGQIDGSDLLAANFEQKVGWIREGAGDRFVDIELGVPLFNITLTDDARGAAEAVLGSWRGTNGPRQGNFSVPDSFSVQDVLDSPFLAIGSPAQIADHFTEMREQFGISLYQVLQDRAQAFASVVDRLVGG